MNNNLWGCCQDTSNYALIDTQEQAYRYQVVNQIKQSKQSTTSSKTTDANSKE